MLVITVIFLLLFLSHSVFADPCDPHEYIVDNDTVALYHMNEGGGPVIIDSTGNHNGIPSPELSWAPGQYCFAIKLFGTEGRKDHVLIPDANDLDVQTGDFTIEAWIRKDRYDNNYDNPIIVKWDPRNGYYVPGSWKFVVSQRLRFMMMNGTNEVWINGDTDIQTYTWYHVAVVKQGQLYTLYVNGELDGVGMWPGANLPTTHNVTIGIYYHPTDPQYNRYYEGRIDEVRISNRARSPSEFNIPNSPLTLEQRVSQLEQELNETKQLLNQTIQRVDVLEILTSSLSDSFNQLTATFNNFAGKIISYLTHTPFTFRKDMVCGYMQDNNLTQYQDLGLTCSISQSGCRCRITGVGDTEGKYEE